MCLILTDSYRKFFSSLLKVSGSKTLLKISLVPTDLGFVLRRSLASSLNCYVTPGLPLRWIPCKLFALLMAGKICSMAVSDRFVAVKSRWISLLLLFKKVNMCSATLASVSITYLRLLPEFPSMQLLCEMFRKRSFLLSLMLLNNKSIFWGSMSFYDRSSSSRCFEDITYFEMLTMSASLRGAFASSNYFKKLLTVIASMSYDVTTGVSLQFEILSSCKW